MSHARLKLGYDLVWNEIPFSTIFIFGDIAVSFLMLLSKNNDYKMEWSMLYVFVPLYILPSVIGGDDFNSLSVGA